MVLVAGLPLTFTTTFVRSSTVSVIFTITVHVVRFVLFVQPTVTGIDDVEVDPPVETVDVETTGRTTGSFLDPAPDVVVLLVEAGGGSVSVSVNDCDAPAPTPFDATIVMPYVPPSPTAGLTNKVPSAPSEIPRGSELGVEKVGAG